MGKQIERWPFYDESSGIYIQESRFYGFGDAGGIAGVGEGYANRAEAIDAIHQEYDSGETITTTPSDLGSHAITILSGREYIDRLLFICEANEESLTVYGVWGD